MTLPASHRFEATQALRQTLARAVEWGLIDSNPAKTGVDNPHPPMSLIDIDRTYGNLARDSHHHTLQLLDDYGVARRDVGAVGRSVDVGTTSAPITATTKRA